MKSGGDRLYKVDDYIFYPMHGAGKIKAIEEKEIRGETQAYYIINMLIGNMQVMIPMNKIANSNIRPIMDLDEVEEVAKSFEVQESDKNLTWKKRNTANVDKIKSGKLKACVEVVHSLFRMQKEDKLNSTEKTLLNQSKEFLLSELKVVEGMNETLKGKFMSILTEKRIVLS
ncbi:CarD family transcriptional regulator [Oceanobacillus sp. CAU 1775]